MKKKKRLVFTTSLVSLCISWGVSYYFNRSDKEAFLLIGAALCLLCLFLLLPFALSRLEQSKALAGGLSFPLMLLPLLLTLSYPTISIAPFTVLWLKPEAGNNYTWALNALINCAVFFIFGFIFVKINGQSKLRWWKNLLFALLIIVFYVFSLYAAALLYETGIYPVMK